MTDFRSELAWLVEDYINLSDVVENDRGHFPGSVEQTEADQKRAKAILSMAGWQPIETCPEVTDVLLFVGSPACVTIIGWRHSAGYFLDSRAEQIKVPLTHWMPLPDPPKD